MNNPSIEAVVRKVKAGDYADLAVAVFGKDAFNDPKTAMTNLAGALFAYEATERFAPFSSKFDDYLRGKAKLTPQEARGFELFTNPKEGNCAACHVGNTESKDPTDWIFTDFTYDLLGVPRNPAIPRTPTLRRSISVCASAPECGLLPKDVKLESLCGQFKVPTLRNVAIAGPYHRQRLFHLVARRRRLLRHA